MSVTVNGTSLHLVSTNILDIKTTSDIGSISNNAAKVVEIVPNSYTVSSTGLYGTTNMLTDVPEWMQNAINISINTSETELNARMDDINDYVSSVETGINETLSGIQNDLTSNYTKTDTLKAEIGEDIAAAVIIVDVKVSEKTSAADVTDILTSKVNDGTIASQSYVTENVSTFANANLTYASDFEQIVSQIEDSETGIAATASNTSNMYSYTGINPDGSLTAGSGYVGVLRADVDDVSVNLTEMSNVFAGTPVQILPTTTADKIYVGMYKIAESATGDPLTATTTTSKYYQYIGGSIGDNGYVEMTTAPTSTNGWIGAAGSLVTDGNTITGWQYTDGSSADSVFRISAGTFIVDDGSGTSTTPTFYVDTSGNIVFNGSVLFTSVDGLGALATEDTVGDSQITSINGGKIITGTVTADEISSNAITADKISAGAITADKLSIIELSAISSDIGNITAGTIVADTIQGGTLNADVINSGSITSSTGGTSSVQWTPEGTGNYTYTVKSVSNSICETLIVQVDIETTCTASGTYPSMYYELRHINASGTDALIRKIMSTGDAEHNWAMCTFALSSSIFDYRTEEVGTYYVKVYVDDIGTNEITHNITMTCLSVKK